MLDQLKLLIGEAFIHIGVLVMPKNNSDTRVWTKHVNIAMSYIYGPTESQVQPLVRITQPGGSYGKTGRVVGYADQVWITLDDDHAGVPQPFWDGEFIVLPRGALPNDQPAHANT